ncbi:unnamed protein product [Cylindrotheca closterium]|uniref:SGNH hydrolase-type esterase domain-containing protein n=1 Tax=Cylindrotheca closterium TaxID=2856 RepID=A0AAD2FVP5_9STRA|nr:unnamed protein product [Cylindrotheca closterium]
MESGRKRDGWLLLTSVILFALLLYGSVDNTMMQGMESDSPNVVQNKTINANTGKGATAATPATSPPTKKEFVEEEGDGIRILCFGDSLTAGLIGINNRQFRPYAPYLETNLGKLQRKSKDNGIVRPVHVNYTGHPGLTSYYLMHGSEAHPSNLNSTLNEFKGDDGTSSLDMVIIMAGTNDLFAQSWLDYSISESVISMHRLVLDEHNIPLTIALDIPGSGRFEDKKLLQEMDALSQGLQAYAKSELRTTFVPFPFPYKGGEKWSRDGIHCSERGYRQLAESLAPVVEQSLQDAGLW